MAHEGKNLRRQPDREKKDIEQLALLNFALDHVLDEVFLSDEHARIHYVNAAACRILGYSRDELLGMTIADIDPDYPLDHWPEHWQELKAEGSLVIESRHKKKDGSIFPVEILINYMDYNGKGYNLGLARDITERKQAEEVLRDSEARMRSIIEAIPMGMHIYQLDENDRLIFSGANPAADRILGVDNSVFIGKTIEQAFPPLAETEVPQRYREAAAGGRPWHAEQVDYDEGGIKGAFDVTAFQIVPRVMVAVFTEITQRKRTEKALMDSESRLRTVMENAPDTILQVDRQGTIMFISRPLPGITTEQVIGSSVYQWVPQESHPVVARALEDAFLTGTRQEYESAGPGPDREVHFYSVRVMPVMIDGRADSAIYIATDITERKQVGEKLKESEERFRRLVEQSPIAIAIIDGSGRIEYSNKKNKEIVGYTVEEAPTLEKWWTLAYPDAGTRQPVMTAWQGIARRVLNGEDVGPFERTIVCKDGSIKDVEMRSSNIGDKILTVFSDISDRRKLEEERLKSQKLESIGTLAGGIAHDFNNLLQGIFGYISMAKMKIDDRVHSLEMLEQAEQALHLSVNLTTQLLTFSKGGKPVKKRLSLRPVIENAVKFSLSGSRSDYRLDIAEDLFSMEADEGQIAQVIQNIVLNADQAMPLGGTVMVSAGNAALSTKQRRGLPVENNFIEIVISDTGVGIPKQYLSNIFDPYFTTKEKGSGIGLATTYAIIKNHDGLIHVESEVGRGTAFSIYLPGIGKQEEAAAAPRVCSSARFCRVLVMDDDPLIRDLVGEMMKTLGHEVVCVAEGDSAVAEYRASMESGSLYDAVILDLTVRGGMGGEEAIRRLLALDPHVRAIVSSGYAESSVISDYKTHGFKGSLRKPYHIEELREVLNSVFS